MTKENLHDQVKQARTNMEAQINTPTTNHVPAIAFDFDGVLHRYSKGWQDGTIYDSINMRVMHLFRALLAKGVAVFILSTRDPEQIKKRLNKRFFTDTDFVVIPSDVTFWTDLSKIGITNRKLPATLYIDDRAHKFTFPETYTKSWDMLLEAINKANTPK